MRKNYKWYFLLFLTGGFSYVCLELICRKRSHVSMFFGGGLGLVFVDLCCNRLKGAKKLSLFFRGVMGSGIITVIELLTGLLVNKRLKLKVWDYSGIPLNFKGQICLRYSLLWYMLSLPAMLASGKLSSMVKKLL